MTDAAGTEFSFAVRLSEIGSSGDDSRYDLQAGADQRSALAARFGCVEISRFMVRLIITPLRKDGHFRVGGTISARVVQNCVVSLAPVVSDIDKEFSFLLLPEIDGENRSLDVEDEEFETYAGNIIDLGEIAAVELALALDPYPRAPGVSGTDLGPGGNEIGDKVRVGQDRPFEALAALKRKG